MARTNKSLVSDFIKDMLFSSQPQDVETKFSKKIVSVMKDSDFWKTTVITKDNKSSISKNISVNVSVGDMFERSYICNKKEIRRTFNVCLIK